MEHLLPVLRCPRDVGTLERVSEDELACGAGHKYPIIRGIPVLLVPEDDPTRYAADTVALLGGQDLPSTEPSNGIDPYVADVLPSTNGYLYRTARLTRYPIPEIRLPNGEGRMLVDVGAGWGRWSISAARAGYRVIAIDPLYQMCAAALRVSRSLRIPIDVVCADATHLPIADRKVDVVFSYSVLQHFAKEVARNAIAEASRVARDEGTVLIQLPNARGARQLINRARQALGRGDAEHHFRVRYWTPAEIERVFGRLIGPTSVEVDGFLSLDAQRADFDILSPAARVVVSTSEVLRWTARRFPPLLAVADSLYARSTVRHSGPS